MIKSKLGMIFKTWTRWKLDAIFGFGMCSRKMICMLTDLQQPLTLEFSQTLFKQGLSLPCMVVTSVGQQSLSFLA